MRPPDNPLRSWDLGRTTIGPLKITSSRLDVLINSHDTWCWWKVLVIQAQVGIQPLTIDLDLYSQRHV